MSIDFKDIYRIKKVPFKLCTQKKTFLDFLSREAFFFSPQNTLDRSKRVSGSLLCMFLFIFKAFRIFFNNIFCVRQKGKKYSSTRENWCTMWNWRTRTKRVKKRPHHPMPYLYLPPSHYQDYIVPKQVLRKTFRLWFIVKFSEKLSSHWCLVRLWNGLKALFSDEMKV